MTLTLGMGSGMAQIFMPRLFGDLDKILPGVRLEILTAPTKNIFNDLHEERIDAGIAIESDPERVPAGLLFERLTEAEMALIVHPEPPAGASRQAGRCRPAGGRADHHERVDSGLWPGGASLFSDLGIRPNILAVADNIETMKVIVQSGKGIAIVPRACADNEVALGVLKVLPITPARSVAFSLFRRRQPLVAPQGAAISPRCARR